MVACRFRDAVATELLQDGLGEDKSDHRFGDDTRCGHRTDVGALVDGFGRFVGGDIDGVEGAGNGR